MDSVLDYFNAVGFYHEEGLIEIRDIARILGDYLAVIHERKIVKEYLAFCEEWEYDETIGAPEPFPFLAILLDEFLRFNEEEGAKREVATAYASIFAVANTLRR